MLKIDTSTDVISKGIDLRDFYPSVEWDILDVPAQKNYKNYTCCPQPFPDITYNITMRRKTLFHTVKPDCPVRCDIFPDSAGFLPAKRQWWEDYIVYLHSALTYRVLFTASGYYSAYKY